MPAVASSFEAQMKQTLRAYPMQLYPPPTSQNTATTGLVLRRAKQIKLMPFPTHRLSVAVFLSVAGYSPFRTIKGSSRLWFVKL